MTNAIIGFPSDHTLLISMPQSYVGNASLLDLSTE